MPVEDPREPRFDTTPSPRPELSDPWRAPPGRQAPEPEPPSPLPRFNLWTVGIGVGIAILLAGGLVYAIGHRTPESPAPAPSANVTAPAPEAPAAPPPSAAPAPPPAPAPAIPAPTAPVPAPPAAAARPAVPPPAALHPAPPTGKRAAVPQNGPRHRRHSAETSGVWLVQVGAFHAKDHADLTADALVRHGWPAHVVHGHDDWLLVEVTGFKTRDDAETAARKLAANEHVPTEVRQIRKTETP